MKIKKNCAFKQLLCEERLCTVLRDDWNFSPKKNGITLYNLDLKTVLKEKKIQGQNLHGGIEAFSNRAKTSICRGGMCGMVFFFICLVFSLVDLDKV